MIVSAGDESINFHYERRLQRDISQEVLRRQFLALAVSLM